MDEIFSRVPEAGGLSQKEFRDLLIREVIKKKNEHDDRFNMMLAEKDPTRYKAIKQMGVGDWLTLVDLFVKKEKN